MIIAPSAVLGMLGELLAAFPALAGWGHKRQVLSSPTFIVPASFRPHPAASLDGSCYGRRRQWTRGCGNPGQAAGCLSEWVGVPPSADTAYALPVALLLVQNLILSGSWSSDETTTLTAPGMMPDPFSLGGGSVSRTSDGSLSISVPGMHLAGLFCQPLPVLPPSDSPAGRSSWQLISLQEEVFHRDHPRRHRRHQ